MKPRPDKRADTKYRQIANQLLAEIRAGMKAGDKLDPEVKLAERFGVNVLTMREALRVLQEGGVIQRQRAIGTTIVNPLGGNWVSIVCEMNVFSPHSQCLFQRSVIYHLRHFLREAGLPSRISIGESEPGAPSTSNLTSLDFVSDIEADRLAGVLALSLNPDEQWLQKLERRGTPVIGSNSRFAHRVMNDQFEDLNRAITTLMDFGRRRIAYIGWRDPSRDGRLPDALDELRRCYPGVLRPHWIQHDIHPEHAGAGRDDFRAIWEADTEKPDGLIVDDEHFMDDVAQTLAREGIRVPEDLLVVCQRTQGNTREYPFPMIFLESDPRLYAYRMADGFLRLYRGETLPNNTITVPRMLIDDAVRNDPRLPAQVWQRA